MLDKGSVPSLFPSFLFPVTFTLLHKIKANPSLIWNPQGTSASREATLIKAVVCVSAA